METVRVLLKNFCLILKSEVISSILTTTPIFKKNIYNKEQKTFRAAMLVFYEKDIQNWTEVNESR